MSYDRGKYSTNNIYEKKEQRRDLRNTMTPSEVTLWKMLRKKQVNNSRWRRQYSIGPYILDFYCPELRIGIELDGKEHFTSEGELYDNRRSEYLFHTYGIRILRFENEDIYHSISSVLDEINTLIEERRSEFAAGNLLVKGYNGKNETQPRLVGGGQAA